MKVKSFLKPFGRIRVHVHSTSNKDDSVVCWSNELKYLPLGRKLEDKEVQKCELSRFQVLNDTLRGARITEGLDIEVK